MALKRVAFVPMKEKAGHFSPSERCCSVPQLIVQCYLIVSDSDLKHSPTAAMDLVNYSGNIVGPFWEMT